MASTSLCIVLAVSAGVFASAGADLPDASNYQGKKITQIRFEPSRQPLPASQLATAVSVKVNSSLDVRQLRKAMKNLYATGRYSNIEAFAETAPGGVALIFRTVDQWFIGPVEVRGKVKQPPTEGQLSNASRLELGQPLEGDSVSGAVNGLMTLLKRNGFYQATVEPVLTRDSEHQQVDFTFNVELGKRARLTTPAIEGDPKISEKTAISATKWHHWFRWKTDTQQNVQAGLQRLREKYQNEERLSAAVNVKQLKYDPAANRVKPTLHLEGGPKVRIRATGAKISKSKIRRYVPVYQQGSADRDFLVQGARNLLDYFQNQGYFDVKVDFRTKSTGPEEEEITYVVALGSRHKLVSVQVQGNTYFRLEDIRERMFLQPAGLIRWRHGRYSQGMARKDEDAVRSLYQANGFRDARVKVQAIDDYRGKHDELAVILHIEPGPQYLVSKLTIHGMQQIRAETVTDMLASVSGQPFSENNVAMDQNYILGLYQSAGYPDASFEWSSTPKPGRHELEVNYFITEGSRYFVRDLVLTGLHTTRMRLVRPTIALQPGDPLSWTAMGDMQRQLYDLGVFQKVNMAIQNPDGETKDKYVLYHIEEAHRYSVAVGAGAEVAKFGGGSDASLSNPGGATGFSPRASLEASRLNLWGLGHSLNFKSRYSTLDRRALLNYSAPRFRNVDGRNITVTALYDNSRDVRTFSAKRMEASAEMSQKFSKSLTGLLRFSYRRVSVAQGTLKIEPELIPLLAQPARIGMLSASLVQDRRDNPTSAHKGIYNTLDVGTASNIFGSSRSFVRVLARDATYHTFHHNLVLARSLEFGWIAPFRLPSGVTSTDAVPLPERFFGGGSTSLRAFPDNQAGPRDLETGFPIGGNALLFHNTELRFPLIGDNINGVLFHDMGNIYSSIRNISFRVHQKDLSDFNYMVHAVGFGIRYRTPIGPVRLDLAYSLNPPSFYGFKGTYEQLLFGTGTKTVQNISHFQFFFSIGETF